MDYTLMTPGPVPVPQEVLDVLALPMEHHRTPEFLRLFARVLEQLKSVFATAEPVFIHTSTGSGAMESALVNCLSPGDEVIAIVSGKFGERWADMAETFGARVTRLDVPWGQAVKPTDVETALKKQPNAVAVLCQACETSTAVLHPIRAIAEVVARHRAVLMVDAITALGAMEMPMDAWGIDVMIGGSQKAFMLPAGLSFISLSKKAWARSVQAKCAKYYFDLKREKDANAKGESYFSTAVTHIRALDLVLGLFLSRGMDSVYRRIHGLSLATVEAARLIGLESFAEAPSPSVTALKVPGGIEGQKLREDLEKSGHIVVMGGQDRLKGKIIRIGHMGAISDDDVANTITALAKSLNRLKPGMVADAAVNHAVTRAREILKKTPAVVLSRPKS